MTDDYITGVDRNSAHKPWSKHHYYRGTMADPGKPMCYLGWNRGGVGYSIFRNNYGNAGPCQLCLKNIAAGKPPIEPKERETRWL